MCSLVHWCKLCIRQHLVLDTVWSSIIRIQPNAPEDGHIDAPKHVELFIIINKLLHQVGISRQQHMYFLLYPTFPRSFGHNAASAEIVFRTRRCRILHSFLETIFP